MSTRASPAHPPLKCRADAERAAYKRMVRGQVTAAEYLAAIVPAKRSRRWSRAR